MSKSKIAIIMGSKSDLDVMIGAFDICEKFGIGFEKKVMSAHRTHDMVAAFAKSAKSSGIEVIIAAAGGAAHLAGVVAALTPIPVIGLPIATNMMGGLDSLLSTVQMPSGVPVATVGTNNSKNAALLAIRILALKDDSLTQKLLDYAEEERRKIESTLI